MDNGGNLNTKLYEKRDDFTFPAVTMYLINESRIVQAMLYLVFLNKAKL
jgi:hypothetical protein